FGAGVNESVPSLEMAGAARKSAGRSLVTSNSTDWPASLAGPGEIAVAQCGRDCRPQSSSTVMSSPLTKDGGSFTGFTVRVILRFVSMVRIRGGGSKNAAAVPILSGSLEN